MCPETPEATTKSQKVSFNMRWCILEMILNHSRYKECSGDQQKTKWSERMFKGRS